MSSGAPRLAERRLPFLCFGAVWLAAVAFLAARGLWARVGQATGEAAALGLFLAVTVRLTRAPPTPQDTLEGPNGEDAPAPGTSPAGPHDGPPVAAPVGPHDEPDDGPPVAAPHPETRQATVRLGAQLAVALAVAVLAAIRFRDTPIWSLLVSFLYRVGRALPIPNANYFVNPALYVVLPGALVLALGARWAGIGFRKGWRPWRVIALWSAPVAGVWIYYLATGEARVDRILRTLLSNTFQNGFGEEFLWRGLIQTRIARLWTPEWGLVLASLAFGWWHINSIHDWAGTDLTLAAALNVVVQAPMGLALGVIFERTRNLLAPSVVHVVANSVTL